MEQRVLWGERVAHLPGKDRITSPKVYLQDILDMRVSSISTHTQILLATKNRTIPSLLLQDAIDLNNEGCNDTQWYKRISRYSITESAAIIIWDIIDDNTTFYSSFLSTGGGQRSDLAHLGAGQLTVGSRCIKS